MFSKLPFRLLRLVFLGALVVFLSALFIKESSGNYPGIVRQLAQRVGIELPYTEESKVNYQVSKENLANQINQTRSSYGLSPLKEDTQLSQAAKLALTKLLTQANPKVTQGFMDEIYKEVGFNNYLQATTNFVFGPSFMYATPSGWLTQRILTEDLKNKAFNRYGLAIKPKGENSLLKQWAVLLILAQVPEGGSNKSLRQPASNYNKAKASQNQSLSKKPRKIKRPQAPTPIVFPDISDQEVIEALNRYRADHKVHQLVVDQNLCEYAEKRVQDLLKHGGLDNHAGFKKDFDVDSPDKLPEPIKRYSGGAIGENLAYQYCKNMKTGESFIAQTGTALIEWCFDSSTAGHREAQLNPRHNAVCVRHANGYYVVIFGE